jgi:hypothetical protein
MFRTAFNLSLVTGAAVAASLALLTGCGNSAGESSPSTSSSRAAATTSTQPERASNECSEAIAAITKASAGGQLSADELDSLAFAGPQSCRDLAELRGALDDDFGPDEGEFLTDFVISACVAGDAWALLGEPSVIADTALCREARSQYTMEEGRRLVPAQATFADYFDGPCRGWSTDQDARASLSCVGGAYRMLVRNPDRPQHSRLFDRPRPRVSVEADIVFLKPRKGEFELHGVTCWSSRSVGYIFALAPDGYYGIVKVDVLRGRQKMVTDGMTERSLTGVGVRNRVRGDCKVGKDSAELALFINGDQVAVARDKAAPKAFTGYGLFVATSERNTDVRFDNVLVRGGES